MMIGRLLKLSLSFTLSYYHFTENGESSVANIQQQVVVVVERHFNLCNQFKK